jgi:hypothetical protein
MAEWSALALRKAMAGNKQQAKEPRAHLDLDQGLCDLGARARAKQPATGTKCIWANCGGAKAKPPAKGPLKEFRRGDAPSTPGLETGFRRRGLPVMTAKSSSKMPPHTPPPQEIRMSAVYLRAARPSA